MAPGYRYIVESSDTLGPPNWVQVTNAPPSFVESTLTLPQAVAGVPSRFYRVRVTAN
jgi:hypothetical protein